jgi:hypothetical protein
VSIADMAGGSWPTLARLALVAFAGYERDDEPIAEALLRRASTP